MKEELQARIIEEFPDFFPGIFGDPMKTCLAFGLDIGDGWYPLFHQLCRDISKANPPDDFAFLQVKEKFGGLRAYYSRGNEVIGDLVSKAEDDSYKTCECCGSTQNVTSEGAWITTLCGNCRLPKEKS